MAGIIKMRAQALAVFCLAILPILCGAHPEPELILEHLKNEIENNLHPNPIRYKRAWVFLENNQEEQAEYDINQLIGDPAWHAQGLNLMAERLLKMRKPFEARKLITGFRLRGKLSSENIQLLGRINLACGDTNAALIAMHDTWVISQSPEDYLAWISLRESFDFLPKQVIEEGMHKFGGHPAISLALYQVCIRNRQKPEMDTSLALDKLGLQISSEASKKWWPASVKWKIRYASALVQMRQRRSASLVLLQALELLDGKPASKRKTSFSNDSRKEIFAMLKLTLGPWTL
jgi:hypothetical protein